MQFMQKQAPSAQAESSRLKQKTFSLSPAQEGSAKAERSDGIAVRADALRYDGRVMLGGSSGNGHC